MKKTSILLVSKHEVFRLSYSTTLSNEYNVLTRQTIPNTDEFIVKRVKLIIIINLWELHSDYTINEFAESAGKPVIVLTDSGNSALRNCAQRNRFLHLLYIPVTNEQLSASISKLLSSPALTSESQRDDREISHEDAFKKAYKSPVFRRKIDKVIQFIEANYPTIENFHQLSEKFDLNYESMRRAFEYKTGLLPQEYLKELRLEKVLQLIQFTSLNIDEICIETGLKDARYAGEIFLSRFGISLEECIAQFRTV
ncbi:helix-turn-helix domain-containing protein [candidate division KSB1 bacterium]